MWQELLAQADSLLKAHAVDSAIVVGRQAYERAAEETTPSDTAAAHILFRLAFFHDQKSDLDSALRLYQEADERIKRVLGPEHAQRASYVNAVAFILLKQGRLQEAEPLYLRVLRLNEADLGPEHVKVASALNNLGICYRRMGLYDTAGVLFERSLAIRLKTLGPDDPKVGGSYQNLGNIASSTGRYGEAEAFYRQAAAVKEKTLPPNHPSLANSLNGLAIALAQQGRYADAEQLYLRAIHIFEEALGPKHPALTEPLLNLATTYHNLGKLKEAERIDRRSLEILQEALGTEHPDVAAGLNNLAHRLEAQGRFDLARPMLKEALRIRRKVLGESHVLTAQSTLMLARLELDAERREIARDLFRDALDLFREVPAFDRIVLGELWGGLGRSYTESGQLDSAQVAFDSALAVMRTLSPVAEVRLVGVFEGQSVLFRRLNKPVEATAAAQRAYLVRQANFWQNADVLPEHDALSLAGQARQAQDFYLSSLVDANPGEVAIARAIAEVVLSTKGQVTDLMHARHRNLLTLNDPQLRRIAREYRTARLQLAERFMNPDAAEPTLGGRLDSLEAHARELETELVRQSREFQPWSVTKAVRIDEVRAALPARSTLVEFARFAYRTARSREAVPHYIAVILSRSSKPIAVHLGEAEPIDADIGRLQRHFQNLSEESGGITEADENVYRGVAHDLFSRVWQPLARHIPEGDITLLVPDGELCVLSFAGLVDADGAYLIERNPIHYLSSGRDLLRSHPTPRLASNRLLLALGDPDFDSPPALHPPEHGLPEDSTPLAGMPLAVRSALPGCQSFQELKVTPLPGTRHEVTAVVESWRNRPGHSAEALLGTQASEERFKAEAENTHTLHIATHGYFLEGVCAPKQDTEAGRFAGENPLLLTGLLLAGANLHSEAPNPSATEDGVLTAEEVIAMDFTGTERVVLSACETGLGQVRKGEGVYGLRRAFLVAGAHTVVSALWRISDREAVKFMTRFYTTDADSYAQLMQEVALQQLREQRRRGRSDHPYNWAGFVVTGGLGLKN